MIQRLATPLVPFPLELSEWATWPLAAQAPRVLIDGPSASRPLAPHLMVFAAPILGTCDFVGSLVRPYCYHKYFLLSKHANEQRLSMCAFHCIIRLGDYLVRT